MYLEHDPIDDHEDMYPSSKGRVNLNTAFRYIVRALRAAGFPVSDDHSHWQPPKDTDTTLWHVKQDVSIERDHGDGYEYFQIEITSPAYEHTTDALANIADFCKLMTSTFRVITNEKANCGLHVHVGYGGRGYSEDHIRKVLAILWAFNSQFNTLHSPKRINNLYCGSKRHRTLMPTDWSLVEGRAVTAQEGTQFYLADRSVNFPWPWLQAAGGSGGHTKDTAINVNNLTPDGKKTFEFRMHRGTLDPIAVVNWIETVTGLIRYAQFVHPAALANVLGVVAHESWYSRILAASANGRQSKDIFGTLAELQQTEANEGPHIADGQFTIVDLLRHMKLDGPAKYYEERGLYRHVCGDDAKPQPCAGGAEGADAVDDNDGPEPARRGGNWQPSGNASSRSRSESDGPLLPPLRRSMAPTFDNIAYYTLGGGESSSPVGLLDLVQQDQEPEAERIFEDFGPYQEPPLWASAALLHWLERRTQWDVLAVDTPASQPSSEISLSSGALSTNSRMSFQTRPLRVVNTARSARSSSVASEVGARFPLLTGVTTERDRELTAASQDMSTYGRAPVPGMATERTSQVPVPIQAARPTGIRFALDDGSNYGSLLLSAGLLPQAQAATPVNRRFLLCSDSGSISYQNSSDRVALASLETLGTSTKSRGKRDGVSPA